MNDNPTALDLSEAARLIREGTLTSEAAVQACLERIETWQPSRNCFIQINAERALAAARLRDKELAAGRQRGPLHGVPIANKDMFYEAGEICTAGSAIRKNWRASTTSAVVERLEAAGAVLVGTLNMAEFAAGPTGHNMHFGDCRNAFHPDYISGGSSSGSAVAVAARLIFGSVGSDTGASIRVPAAANGVLGLKPTYGSISRYGAVPRSWSLDHIGPMARTAADCAILMHVLAGRDVRDPSTMAQPPVDYGSMLGFPVDGLRIGMALPDSSVPVDDVVAGCVEETAKLLRSGGAVISSTTLPDLAPLFFAAETIIKCEAAALHREWFESRKNEYGKQLQARLQPGYFIPATQYIDALRLREHFATHFIATTMDKIDALVLPVLPVPVPTLAETDGDGDVPGVRALISRLTALTRPFNLLGFPALSIPAGFCATGLPIGVQLVSRPFHEPLLLRVADWLLQRTHANRVEPLL